MMDMVRLEYKIDRDDFQKAGYASSNAKKVLKNLGIHSEVIRRVSVATYEAEMNIVIHSLGGEIEILVFPERIRIIARDLGPGILDTGKAMQRGYSTASDRVREMGFGAGMGLPNMKRCSDEFSIVSTENQGTEVIMTIYI